MKINANTRALVTGASSGLGKSIAQRLAAKGAQVIATGRSRDRLESVAADGPGIIPIAGDLTSTLDRRRLIEETRERFGRLDLLVNCAGVGAYGHFDTHDEATLRRVFEINFFAAAELTRAALPLLRQSDSAVAANVGSIVARRGLPARLEYSASKFALAAFTESLRSEWVRYGIHVMLINPGFTQTPFEDNLLVDTAVYKTKSWRSASADDVASAAIRAIERQRNEVTLTPRGRFLLLVNRLMPRFVDWGMARFTLKLYPDSPALQKKKRSVKSV